MRVFVGWHDWFGEERELPLQVDDGISFGELWAYIGSETDLPLNDYDLFLHKYDIRTLNGYSDDQPLSWLLSENARLTLRSKPEGRAGVGAEVGAGKQGAQCSDEVSIDPTPTFLLEEAKEWKAYLADNGYVVIRDVLSSSEVNHARDLLWEWLSLLSDGHLRRGQPQTWVHPSWPANKDTGIVDGYGVGQSEFNWFIRGLPRVKQAFELIWGQSNLLSSFDGAALFRPWLLQRDLRTQGGWYHVDQNANMSDLADKNIGGLACVQGLVPLFPADPSTGGLTVIPGSHLQHVAVCRRALVSRSHYVPLDLREPVLQNPAKLVCAPAGALCLWDSRTIHCNSPGRSLAVLEPSSHSPVCLFCGRVFPSPSLRLDHQEQSSHSHRLPGSRAQSFHASNATELLRAVCMVCMTPAHWADSDVLLQRRKCWENHTTASHWPHLPIRGTSAPTKFVPHLRPLGAPQSALVG